MAILHLTSANYNENIIGMNLFLSQFRQVCFKERKWRKQFLLRKNYFNRL